MNLAAPWDAPTRTDLPFLQRRAAAERVTLPRPKQARPAEPAASSGLDLSAPAPVAKPTTPVRRVSAVKPELLTQPAPVLRLTRPQSGVGALTVEAACSAEVGDVRLAAAYRLASGQMGLVSHEVGVAQAPAGGRPALLSKPGRFETLLVDLRQVPSLDRLLLLLFSASKTTLTWGGTLLLSTTGGSRVEIGIEAPPSAGALGVATVYQLDGELVVRAEPQQSAPTVKDACLMFGFDRITWLDARTPSG